MSKTEKIVAGLGIAAALGVAVLPIASTFAAPATGNVTVKVTIGSTIAISATAPAEVNTEPNKKVSTAAANVKVTTNSLGGYRLDVKDADTNLALTSADSSDTIPALGGTLTAGTAGWNLTGGDLTDAAISATDQTVKTNTNSAKTAISEETPMVYNFATSDTQMQGTYTDTITYTATAL